MDTLDNCRLKSNTVFQKDYTRPMSMFFFFFFFLTFLLSYYFPGFGPTMMSASFTCWWTTCQAVSCLATYAAVGASATTLASSIPLRLYAPSSTSTPKKSSTVTWSLRTSCWTVKDTFAWLTLASLRSSLTGDRNNISVDFDNCKYRVIYKEIKITWN